MGTSLKKNNSYCYGYDYDYGDDYDTDCDYIDDYILVKWFIFFLYPAKKTERTEVIGTS